jgi:hypothetical protein
MNLQAIEDPLYRSNLIESKARQMNQSFDDIRELVNSLADKIKAPLQLLPTYGRTVDSAHPHIDIDGNGRYNYVVVERGEELSRDIAADTNDLLFMIFSGVTFSLACDFEVKHRRKNEDSRRQLFAKQEELLGMLNKEWRIREQKEHQEILKRHPFNDK